MVSGWVVELLIEQTKTAMIRNVDIFAVDITLESIRDELKVHPWRLEERDVDVGNGMGNTPLMSAADFGKVDVVQFLLLLGANIEAKNTVCLVFV